MARRHDLNANPLFKWKLRAEVGRLGGSLATAEIPEFVPIGVVGRAGDGGPALLARMPGAEGRIQRSKPGEPRWLAGLECRPT